MKSCPVPDCRGIRADDKLLCWECWQHLPIALQQAVYRTYGAYRRARGGRRWNECLAAYKTAAHAAITAAAKARAA